MFRNWNAGDFGTAKPVSEKKVKVGVMTIGEIHGIRGGVPFHEPIRFQFKAKGAKLFNGANPSNGKPQEK